MRPSLARLERTAMTIAGALIGACLVVALHACGTAVTRDPIDLPDAEAPPLSGLGGADAASVPRDVDLGDSFALYGVSPTHGPFTGGVRAVLTGRGFSSNMRVFFGATELDPSSVVASDATRAAVVVPAGPPGRVRVTLRDPVAGKERVLEDAFTYDAFVVDPPTGAVSGGTRILVTGSGTAWTPGTSIRVGGKDCASVIVTDFTHISCVTPAGAPGAKDVEVSHEGQTLQARDAFTYSDATDGARGGLSGGALAGRLRVRVFDGFTGDALPASRVVIGNDLASTSLTNASGVVDLASDAGLAGKVTVTIAAKCHQPQTFVDVPVDTLSVYLAPVLDPSCGEGDPPQVGGRGGRYGGQISGELVFRRTTEAPRGPFTGVPAARPNERAVAYVFAAGGSPSAPFSLPPADRAVTPASPGTRGYAYTAYTYPGNVTLYALAGLEDRGVTPPRFTAFAMGVARGIAVAPGAAIDAVDMTMDALLDHEITLDVTPPSATPRGPDRLKADVALTLGPTAFATLPAGSRSVPISASGPLRFVGVPALSGTLSGERYVVGASALTGPEGAPPASFVSRVQTTDSANPIAIGGFLEIPTVTAPGAEPWNGLRAAFDSPSTRDVSVLTISSGIVSWLVVFPGDQSAVDLPDLAALSEGFAPLGIPRGAIRTTLYTARLAPPFAYSTLRYGQLQSNSFAAFAVDARTSVY